jgi:hypothetical protein
MHVQANVLHGTPIFARCTIVPSSDDIQTAALPASHMAMLCALNNHVRTMRAVQLRRFKAGQGATAFPATAAPLVRSPAGALLSPGSARTWLQERLALAQQCCANMEHAVRAARITGPRSCTPQIGRHCAAPHAGAAGTGERTASPAACAAAAAAGGPRSGRDAQPRRGCAREPRTPRCARHLAGGAQPGCSAPRVSRGAPAGQRGCAARTHTTGAAARRGSRPPPHCHRGHTVAARVGWQHRPAGSHAN